MFDFISIDSLFGWIWQGFESLRFYFSEAFSTAFFNSSHFFIFISSAIIFVVGFHCKKGITGWLCKVCGFLLAFFTFIDFILNRF